MVFGILLDIVNISLNTDDANVITCSKSRDRSCGPNALLLLSHWRHFRHSLQIVALAKSTHLKLI